MMRGKRANRPPRYARSSWERLGVVYALLAVAEAVVLLLGWQSNRALKNHRRTVEQNLVEFARFGATNFAYRSGSILANHAVTLGEALDRGGVRPDAAALARGRFLADSLEQCECETGLRVTTVMLLDGNGVVLAASPSPAPALPPQQVAAMIARLRSFKTKVVAVRMTDELGQPAILGIAAAPGSTATRERFILTQFDPQSVREKAFGFIYDARPPLMPSVFGIKSHNAKILAIRVVLLPNGTVLYRSPTEADTTFQAIARFGFDTAVKVYAALTPGAARGIPGGADQSYRSGAALFGTLVATWVIGLIAVLLHRTARLARLRADFTAAVSHELRTPLTEIMLYAELIDTGRAAGESATTNAARVILAEARRLYHLVENVLVIARTDRRMLRVRLEAHDLAVIVRETVNSFGLLAAKRRVQVVAQLPPSLMVQCDASAMACVLVNLLDNAVRYGPEAQTIYVRGRQVDDASVVIEVDDAGRGIPVTERRRVLDPYVRLDRDVEASVSGSGLGLAVVAALVMEMRGTLTIEDSQRGGALVKVVLPGAGRSEEAPEGNADGRSHHPQEDFAGHATSAVRSTIP